MIGALDRWTGRLARALAFIGGLVVLLAMALLTVADVIGRNFGLGIPASWELVTFAMRWMIGLSLPFAFYAGRHVAVEAFTDFLRPRLRLAFILLGEAAALVAMSLLAWRLHVRGSDILGFGTRTSDLGMLTFYHWLPLILGAALSALVLAVLVLRDGMALAGGRVGRQVPGPVLDPAQDPAQDMERRP